MSNRFALPTFSRRVWIAVCVVLVFAAVGLGLDLANRGLVWRFAWSVTGEETPIGQARGLLEYAASFTRPQPRTAPLSPVNYAHVNPYGVNTFLQLEADPAKVDAQLAMIAAAGFAWIRQQFEWAEIEVDGRGQFTDSRNDVTGDGRADTISGWDKYDRIVALSEQYGLSIQARLDNPPRWSRSRADSGDFAPPDDFQDFVRFATAVAERYKGRIQFYQVWNEPNIYPEWGNQPVNPEAYTELLCRTYDALKAVDPQIVVISGALAPTVALSGRDLNDFLFLQRMYDAGAGRCFDILSMQGYGLFSGPTDRRMRPTTVNIARNLYIRDLMLANGDGHKAIWFSEMAWNPVPGAAEVPDIADRERFGQVTPEQAAAYVPRLYQRAQEEWPWVGVINYWFFTRPTDFERGQSFYYFRLVEPDYRDDKPTFTPTPTYTALRDFIAAQTPVLHTGAHRGDGHWAVAVREVIYDDSIEAQQANLSSVLEHTFTVRGTDVRLQWEGVLLSVSVDDVYLDVESAVRTLGSGTRPPQTVTVLHSTLPRTATIRLVTDAPFILDTIIVQDRTWINLMPAFVVGITTLVLGIVVVIGMRVR